MQGQISEETYMAPPLSSSPILCLVTNRKRLKTRDLVDVVCEAVSGGVTMIQIREKDLPVFELAKLLEKFSEKIGEKAIIAVNASYYTDCFALADAIHFPEESPLVVANFGKILGRSIHSIESARIALENGADYLIAGTIFESTSHPGRDEAGLEFLQKIYDDICFVLLHQS
mgnify:CR=1 FL=1